MMQSCAQVCETLGPDDETLNTCPCCQGHGTQELRTKDLDGRDVFIGNECYLCGGRGAIHYHTLVMWHDAGRPTARMT